MKAIGRLDHVDSKGNQSVTMFYDGKWQGELGSIKQDAHRSYLRTV